MRQHEHVILLRNASSIDPQQDAAAGQTTADPYEFAITARGLLPHTLPVLGQEFVNVSRLQEVFQHPEDWAAVVATSKRAGEAWVDAIRSRPADNKEINWSQTPLYTPGAATTSAFSSADLPRRWFPTIVNGSEETGCAEHLGPFIVSDKHHQQQQHQHQQHQRPNQSETSGSGSSTKPILVLTGDKNSSELTDHLHCNQLKYVELEVYRTTPRPDIHPRLVTLLTSIAAASSSFADGGGERTAVTVWVACFSPSSAEAVLHAPSAASAASITTTTTNTKDTPSYTWIHDLAINLAARYHVDITIRMAAIGKTTRNYLVMRGFQGVVQADKPNAECLARVCC